MNKIIKKEMKQVGAKCIAGAGVRRFEKLLSQHLVRFSFVTKGNNEQKMD